MIDHILERPPKILILGEAAAVHTRRWVEHFRGMGWTVRWLSFAPLADAFGVEEIPDLARRRALAIWKARAYVRTAIDQFQPDVISALYLPDYGWLACMTKRHPVAVSAWGSDVLIAPRKSTVHRWRIQYVLKRADWLFCDADLIKEEMVELGAPRDRIQMVPLGVSDEWLEVGKNRSANPEPPIHVVSNRRHELLYRVDTFIHAIQALESSRPGHFRYTIASDGSERPSLESLATDLGVRNQITFTGTLTDEQVRDLLADADVFVSCSSSDGTSVSLLEAMAAGVFPIVTDLPANREWLTPNKTGVLLPVGDHAQLAQAITLAADDLELRERAMRANHDLVTQRARWGDNMRQVEEDLLQLIAQNVRLLRQDKAQT